jgi:hypothetical protein
MERGHGGAIPVSVPVSLSLGETEKPLVVRAEQLHAKAKKLQNKADLIFGELYSSNCRDGIDDSVAPRMNLNDAITETDYVLNSINHCLSEILLRLNGNEG